ncbi:hypothetical protein [Cyanobium sp. CH-040]|uniref:hypothetical protein n=1 Tax=Cyanobium sp. CH-040 TaxID=2823708 RepID=UPI0020CD7E3C|nr:hypothetical protein [Cyanobium sp. CH-040]MCP9929001.1 hypothetical protein [Cyanobium sp. CH-040]
MSPIHPITSALLAALSGSSLLLAACSGGKPPEAELPEPPAPAAAKPDQAAPPVRAEVAGFTPLPSTNQVLAANPIGRSDPFASDRPVVAARPAGATGPGGTAAPAPARPAPLQLPPGFQFSGVIRVGSSPQAMVQFGPSSGAVGIGERGGSSTDLLPAGWVVSSIDVDRGRLVLRQGSQTVTAEL